MMLADIIRGRVNCRYVLFYEVGVGGWHVTTTYEIRRVFFAEVAHRFSFQFPHSFGRIACAFPQNFHIMKLGEITVFYAVWNMQYIFITQNKAH